MNFILEDLKAKRKVLGEKAQKLVNKAISENRSMTSAETAEFDSLTREYEAVNKKHDDTVAALTTPNIDQRSSESATEVRALSATEKATDFVRAHGAEAYDGLTFGGFLRSMVIGPKNEAERRAMSEGTLTAGGHTTPTILAAEVIDKLRAQLVSTRLGGRVVPLTSDKNHFARVTSDPAATWRAENAAISESDGAFDRVEFSPKVLAVITRVSREMLEDTVNGDKALENAILSSMAVQLDAATLVGSGSSNQPTGIANTSGIGSVSMGTNGAALANYAKLLEAVYTVEASNSAVTGFAMNPRTSYALNGLADTTGQPLRKPDSLATLPMLSTTSIGVADSQGSASNASKIIGGYWPDCWIGLRTSLRVEVLRERYADSFQYAFLAYLRADVQLARPASFVKIVGITPAA